MAAQWGGVELGRAPAEFVTESYRGVSEFADMANGNAPSAAAESVTQLAPGFRRCTWCGVQFLPKRWIDDEKDAYHSNACRQAAYRARHKVG